MHGLTFEVLQHQVVRSYVVHLADVGMVERRDRARLALEPLAVLRRQLLDRDDAVEPGVEGFVDFAHAAGPNQGLDFVRAEVGSGRQRHIRTRSQSIANASMSGRLPLYATACLGSSGLAQERATRPARPVQA